MLGFKVILEKVIFKTETPKMKFFLMKIGEHNSLFQFKYVIRNQKLSGINNKILNDINKNECCMFIFIIYIKS